MKKQLMIIIIVLFSISAYSQVGIGARGLLGMDGNSYGGLEFSVQKPGQWEFDLGTANDSWKATALKHKGIIDRRNLGLYWGGGMGLGYYEPYDEFFGTLALNLGSYLRLGRVQLGLDWRPEWNFFNYSGNDLSFSLALSGRWMFGVQ